MENKLYDWLDRIKEIKEEGEVRDQCERDFWKFIFNKKQKKGENSDDNPIFQEEWVTSITLCYDLTEIENLN